MSQPSYEQLLEDNKKLTEQNALWRDQVEYITGGGALTRDIFDSSTLLTRILDQHISDLPWTRISIRNLAGRLRDHVLRIEDGE